MACALMAGSGGSLLSWRSTYFAIVRNGIDAVEGLSTAGCRVNPNAVVRIYIYIVWLEGRHKARSLKAAAVQAEEAAVPLGIAGNQTYSMARKVDVPVGEEVCVPVGEEVAKVGEEEALSVGEGDLPVGEEELLEG